MVILNGTFQKHFILCAVTLGNLSHNLSRNFVASLQHKLHESYETLCSVTCPEMNLSRNIFVEAAVARIAINFYFSQQF